jgi:mRNA-degrading endonuclease toxin of MazEF toxin-antitoxin module
MKVERGDVVLTRVPHAAGGRGKKRPAVVIQADHYNQSERFVIVAEITTNLTRVADPANLLVETPTHEGKCTGLAQDSLVTCLQLATISEDRITTVIGKLSAAMLRQVSDCLKTTLDIPRQRQARQCP